MRVPQRRRASPAAPAARCTAGAARRRAPAGVQAGRVLAAAGAPGAGVDRTRPDGTKVLLSTSASSTGAAGARAATTCTGGARRRPERATYRAEPWPMYLAVRARQLTAAGLGVAAYPPGSPPELCADRPGSNAAQARPPGDPPRADPRPGHRRRPAPARRRATWTSPGREDPATGASQRLSRLEPRHASGLSCSRGARRLRLDLGAQPLDVDVEGLGVARRSRRPRPGRSAARG